MQITDSAKIILEKLLEEEQKNCLTFFTEGSGCQTRLCMDFIVVSDGNQINGLYVDMSEETSRLLEDIVLDAKNGSLVIQSRGGCSGCCSSCSQGCQ
ncbi:MAG: hypothetical protein ACI4UK_07870 [Floccifex sp.]